MGKAVDALRRRYGAVRERAATVVEGRRKAWHWFDHAVSAHGRYQVRKGDRLAAGLTYYAFLSLFPLIALAFSVAGYLVVAYPDIGHDVTKAINDALPGLGERLPVSQIAAAKEGTGVVGVVLLAWAGLGWVSALRDALRAVMLDPDAEDSFVTGKLRDLAALVLLGGALAVSAAMSGFATSATNGVLKTLGLGGQAWTVILARAVPLAVALATDVVVFLVMFGWLAHFTARRRVLLRGALLGGIALEILKTLGTYLVGRALSNPIYATLAVTAGLLVWINMSSRLVLMAAGWTATADE